MGPPYYKQPARRFSSRAQPPALTWDDRVLRTQQSLLTSRDLADVASFHNAVGLIMGARDDQPSARSSFGGLKNMTLVSLWILQHKQWCIVHDITAASRRFLRPLGEPMLLSSYPSWVFTSRSSKMGWEAVQTIVGSLIKERLDPKGALWPVLVGSVPCVDSFPSRYWAFCLEIACLSCILPSLRCLVVLFTSPLHSSLPLLQSLMPCNILVLVTAMIL